jgi:adenosylhomocysteine nucleosidase
MYRILSRVILVCLFFSNGLLATTAREVFAKKEPFTIGIISSVPGESGHLLELMESPVSQEKGRRTYHKGKLQGINTVLVASRIGKVAAAATVTHLIIEYQVDLIIFTGVAGAIDRSLNIGDVVVADALIQHDMDARPFCNIYEIPLLKIKSCTPDPLLTTFAIEASEKFLHNELTEKVPAAILNEFQITKPKIAKGLVLTGDQVISRESQKLQLQENIPEALCVEMEGASVGQVCYEYGVPFTVIRTISDYANHQHTPIDVKKFVQLASGYYSVAIINNIYSLIHANARVHPQYQISPISNSRMKE